MQMLEVINEQDRKQFLEMPIPIYANDENWIRPLDKDIEEVFDPAKNKFFKQGECKRWLLKDKQGKVLGRIAAFINKKYKNDQPTGGIGFFECTNDQNAANFMFDHCKNWLKERGMEAMDGPINFGERDRWWGLQIEGFQPPLYCMNYNPPYYQQLFESYGFKPYYYQLCYAMEVKTKLQEKFYKRHHEVSQDPNFRFIPIDKKQLNKFAADFAKVYNKAWAGHGGGKQIEERAVLKMFKKMKPVLDENITWFTYYKDEPIGIWVNLPDLNQYFRHLNGKFGWLQKLKFLWLQKFGSCSKFVGLVFGIIPEFQGKGVDSYMIVEASQIVQPNSKYSQYEMMWVGDFNPKMVNIAENLGTHCSRKLATYRYLFDQNLVFKRHPMLT
ncbi:MAG: hypothetical protein JST52_01795 [Bacteroidetes bacterium]|nr:hypothetical protein [Bacteroidota bacterium]MBS1741317.1 hypothetical protein [Bacteroidota bacterium]